MSVKVAVLIVTVVAASASGCRDDAASSRTKSVVASADLAIVAEMRTQPLSSSFTTKLKRLHAERIVSIENCRNAVRLLQAEKPDLSWLSGFTAEADPTEAAANALLGSVHAVPYADCMSVRIEITATSDDATLVLSAVGDSYIRAARLQEINRLEQDAKFLQLELDEEVSKELGDAEDYWPMYLDRRRELDQLLYRWQLLETRLDLVRRLGAVKPDSAEEKAKAKAMTAEITAINDRISALSNEVGSWSFILRSPDKVRRKQQRIQEKAWDNETQLCELNLYSDGGPVKWSRRPVRESPNP